MTFISITDALTNETITREMTYEELTQREKDTAEQLAIKAKHQAQADAKAQAKAVAEGKLAALGLTTDDLRALGL
jgi:hypothetical protein